MCNKAFEHIIIIIVIIYLLFSKNSINYSEVPSFSKKTNNNTN